MTILYPTSMFPKLSETFILEQITGLIDLGHDVKIVAFWRPDEKVFHPQVEKYRLLEKTLYIPKLDTEPGFEFTPDAIEFLKDVDIIHAHFAALPTDFAMHASKLLGIPFVFTTHAYDIFVHTGAEKLAEYAASAERIITVSDFNRRYMLDLIGERYRDKIEIVRCGIDVNRFSQVERPLRDEVTILTMGRFVEKKGIPYAIRAMAKLPENCSAVLRVIGEGPLRGEIEQTIADLNIEDRVVLLGGLPQSEVIREMQQADIFILPSVTAANNDREGLPVSILEAQAMKLPVVSTFHTGIPEGVIDGVTGSLVAEKDADALAEKLCMLINDRDLRQRMGEKGRCHVAAHFNIDAEIRKLEGILSSAARNPLEGRQSVVPGHSRLGTGVPPDRKIKVLIVSHSSHFYGAEQSLLVFLQNLDRERFDPVVTLPEPLPEHEERLRKGIEALDIKTIFVDSPMWIDIADYSTLVKNLLEELYAVRSVIDIIRNEYVDIVYTNSITKISGAIAARLSGVPHVYHVREVLEGHPLQSPFSIPTTFKMLDLFSDGIITNSRFVAGQFDTISGKNKVNAVYNAVDVSQFNGLSKSGFLRRELSLPSDCPLVGIIGTLHPHKNHEELIRAFDHLNRSSSPAKLVVVGQPIGDYKDLLVRLVAEFGLEKNVFFLPFRNDIAEIMVELDVIAVPSLAEPFGRVTIEAMAAGKPVVATNAGASPEIVIDGVTGYLVPLGEPERMAEAITKLVADPDKGRAMGQAGRERVLETFTTDNYTSGIERVLYELYKQHNPEAGEPSLREVALHAVKLLEPDEFQHLVTQVIGHAEEFSEQIFKLLPTRDDYLCRLKHDADLYRSLFKDKYAEAQEVYIRLDRAQTRINELELGQEECSKRCKDLENSLSWRVTSPVRKLVDLFKK